MFLYVRTCMTFCLLKWSSFCHLNNYIDFSKKYVRFEKMSIFKIRGTQKKTYFFLNFIFFSVKISVPKNFYGHFNWFESAKQQVNNLHSSMSYQPMLPPPLLNKKEARYLRLIPTVSTFVTQPSLNNILIVGFIPTIELCTSYKF